MKILTYLITVIILGCLIAGPVEATDNLEIWFVWANGHSGTATLIRGPNGTVVLYDEMGGSFGASYLKQLLDDLGITYIDYAIAGHYDQDHIGGLDDLDSSFSTTTESNFGHFYDRGGSLKDDGDPISSSYYDLVTDNSGQRTTVKVDGTTDIVLGDGAIIRFLSVGAPDTTNALYIRGRSDVTSGINENNKSISALVTYGGFDLYLGSDLEGTGENPVSEVIVDDLGRDPDICLVDHHGSDTYGISSLAFCAKMDPEVAVISVWSNSYGHPRGTTVENFQAAVEPEDQRILRLHPGDTGDYSWAEEDMDYCHTTNRHIYVYTNGVNYTVDTVDRAGGLGNDITEPGLINHYADEGYQLLITEVATDANQPLGHDWVELSMKLGMADLTEVYMTDREDVFPVAGNDTLTMTSGDLLIIHDTGGTSENDSLGKGTNGLWDVYQSSINLDPNDDQFIITTQNSASPDGGNIIDAVCWSNDDGSMWSGEIADGNNLISNNHWGDPDQGEGQFTTTNQGPAIGNINTGYAQRLTFTDHNDVNDWEIAARDSHGDPPPSATPTTTPSPTPSVTPSITPTPSVTPTPTPSNTPTPSTSPTSTPTPSTSPTLTPAPPEGDVVINEIHADPAEYLPGDANGDGYRSGWEDEFVELINWTNQTVDIGGFTLSDATAIRYTFASPFEVPPGNAVVVFGGGFPAGAFGGAQWVTVSDVGYGLYLTNGGDTVTFHNGTFVLDSVTYGPEGREEQSLNRIPERRGFFYLHSEIPESGGRLYSPGTKVNGDSFYYEPTPVSTPSAPPTPTRPPTPPPTPSPSITPIPSPTPTCSTTPPPTPAPTRTASPNPTRTATPAPTRTVTPTPTATPTATLTPSPTPSGTPSPVPSASPSPTQTPIPTPSTSPSLIPTPSPTPTSPTPSPGTPLPTPHSPLPIIDYNGDGITDVAIFRESSGLWAIRGVTRIYFGGLSDDPVPGDYDGNRTTDIGIFRSASGLWAIRGYTRAYFGGSNDLPKPGDYNGDNTTDISIFRDYSGLWAVRGITRSYFGRIDDSPAPGYYDRDSTKDIGIFRESTGLWAVRGVTRLYFGSAADTIVPGDYNGDGTWETGIFRPSSGLWAIRGFTRSYFGGISDRPVIGDYNGVGRNNIGIFRESSGLWAIHGVSRLYYGNSGDIPVSR